MARAKPKRWWIVACASLACDPAGASQLTFVGQAIAIVGSLSRGDETLFSQMLAMQGPRRVSFVYLASGGGDIGIAGEIGRRIRAAKLTTVVDAARYPCVDACTAIFVAGTRRVYMHAPAASGNVGAREFRGLGFARKDASESAALIALFKEFGAPQASELIDAAPAEGLFRLSGPEAVARGVATALTPP